MESAAVHRLPQSAQGILPARAIRELADAKAIVAERAFDTDQVQPASLDLRLGARAWRIRASFLPSAKTPISARLEDLALHSISLNSEGTVLETGCVYIVEVEERLALPADVAAATNPKSST
jgi:dCTP deaminase